MGSSRSFDLMAPHATSDIPLPYIGDVISYVENNDQLYRDLCLIYGQIMIFKGVSREVRQSLRFLLITGEAIRTQPLVAFTMRSVVRSDSKTCLWISMPSRQGLILSNSLQSK